MKIETVVPLPPEDSGLQHCIARFHNRNMDSKRKDKTRFFRREPVMIVNPETKAKVLRYAMGNPGNLSITKLAVALDYDAVDALGVRFKDTVNLEVRRARGWEVWQWFWNHPDQSVQLSIKLGVVGAVLGVMGFLTGVAPYRLLFLSENIAVPGLILVPNSITQCTQSAESNLGPWSHRVIELHSTRRRPHFRPKLNRLSMSLGPRSQRTFLYGNQTR
ncbi:hypothetical protein ACY3XD_002574 [Vibrio cholerae]